MDKIRLLKEGLGEKIYRSEPFAEALLHYLVQNGIVDRTQFLKVFDTVIDRNLENIISEQHENEESGKVHL